MLLSVRRLVTVALLYIWTPATAVAADEVAEGWSGGVELGAMVTAGNSDTRTYNAKGELRHKKAAWLNELRLALLQAADGSVTTAESYSGRFKSEYHYRPDYYSFVRLRYERDLFSAYDYSASEVVGQGKRVYDEPGLSLDLELGVGGRQQQPLLGEREDEGIVQGNARLKWQLSEHARFSEELSVEAGESNTYVESESALQSRVVGNLSMKLSHVIKHNTTVPAGTEHTDTVTALTLLYTF